MKKNLFILILAVASAFACALALTACTPNSGDITGEEVTAEQWQQAFNLNLYDHFSVRTISHATQYEQTYSSWNTFSFDGDKVSNIWGNYDGSQSDPFNVTGELIEAKVGESYYRYEKRDGEWTKEDSREELFSITVQNCKWSISRPNMNFDDYEFDSNGGKYVLKNVEEWSSESSTVIIKDGKLYSIEHTTNFDPDTATSYKYSLTFNYGVEITIPSI